MTFQESIKYLTSLGNEVSAMKLGLENISKLLDALGNPEKKYLKVQIAGTNGKGSTCAFLEAICVAAKIKTGLTTSPHLISITERVKISGASISDENFARNATLVRETAEKLVAAHKLETVPTFFEQVTAIALYAFAEAKVELAILETGLGGRFDATTAARAEVVAVTAIDFDHENILGNTIEKIAAEKAAIIHDGARVVLGRQSSKVETILSDVCAEFGVIPNSAQAVKVSENRSIASTNRINNLELNFKTPRAEYKNINLNLRGRHQIENAEIAVLLAEILRENFKISNENICEGLRSAFHKGRLEFYQNFLFDGAHNVAGAKVLRTYLDEFVEKPITLIFAAMNDKNLSEIVKIIFPKTVRIILTRANNSRSVEPEGFLNYAEKYNSGEVFTTKNVAEAVELARRNTGADDLILVTGSLYLIGEAQEYLGL